MTPDNIERVFGRGRLQMVTGAHVEVFREAAAPGESRRYTKRFLTTADGDYAQWTEREWRILARLIGHGSRCVPDVVQYDGGARGVKRVQTFDAGATVDQWATLVTVQRDGRTHAHVFEDCAHWWALAHHCLVALDQIHSLNLIHLDVKGDNVCIPIGPATFDPYAPGQRLFPVFRKLALIDFAFSLVSGETLETALPIGWQQDYDYQSPRLLSALEAGRAGDLAPTEALDWRCDMYSLAAMLKRYLPREAAIDASGVASGWTAHRFDAAKSLILALREAHDRDLPSQRPHGELIARTSAELCAYELVESLDRGWALSHVVRPAAVPALPLTPVTRLAPPDRVVVPPRENTLVPNVIHADARPAGNLGTTSSRKRNVAVAAAAVVAAVAVAALNDDRIASLSDATQRIAEQGRAWRDALREHIAQDAQPAVGSREADDRPTGNAMHDAAPARDTVSESASREAASTSPPKDAGTAASPTTPHDAVSEAPVPQAPIEPAAPSNERFAASPTSASPSTATTAGHAAAAPAPSLATQIESHRARTQSSSRGKRAPSSVTARAPASRPPDSRRTQVASVGKGPRGSPATVATTAARPASQRTPTSVATARVPEGSAAPVLSAATRPVTPTLPAESTGAAANNAAASGTSTTATASPAGAKAPAMANAASPAASGTNPPNIAVAASPSEPAVVLAAVKPSEPVNAATLPEIPPQDARAPASPAQEPRREAIAPVPRGARTLAPIVEASRPAVVPTYAAPRLGPPPSVAEAPRVGSAAIDFASGDGYGARARRLLADVVPRASSIVQARVSRVLWIAAGATSPMQDRAIVDAVSASSENLVAAADDAPAEARRLHDEARRAFRVRRHVPEAFDLAMKAFGASPNDAEIAGHLAFLHLKLLPAQPERARQLALYAIGIRGANAFAGRADDWTTFAIASALTGRSTDARHALYTSLVLSGDTEYSCRAAFGALATYGERLRDPVESLIVRVQAQRRTDDATACNAPGSRVAHYRFQ